MTNDDNNVSKKLLTRREFMVGGGAVLAIAAFAACSNKIAPATSGTSSSKMPSTTTGSASTPGYGGVLTYFPYGGSPGSLGLPAEGQGLTGAAERYVEPLLRADNKGNIYPWLAESYKVADDLKSMTFNLRKGVKFHDGSDFNAGAAKWNLENMIDAKMEPYWDSVDEIDDYTIRLNFTEWISYIPSSFCATPPLIGMVSKAAFDKNGKDWMRQNPVGTGPLNS